METRKTGRRGMGGRDNLKRACVAASGWRDDTRGSSGGRSRTSSKLWRSGCREVVAGTSGAPANRSSFVGWQSGFPDEESSAAGRYFADVLDRTVSSPARAWSDRATGGEETSPSAPARSMQRGRLRLRDSRRCRPFRLCVLMNLILPGAVPWDLAGEILKKCSLASRIFRPAQELSLAITASRSFAERNASVNEPAHADIHCDA